MNKADQVQCWMLDGMPVVFTLDTLAQAVLNSAREGRQATPSHAVIAARLASIRQGLQHDDLVLPLVTYLQHEGNIMTINVLVDYERDGSVQQYRFSFEMLLLDADLLYRLGDGELLPLLPDDLMEALFREEGL